MNPQPKSGSTLVTGANGQLGREICRQLGPAAVPLLKATLNITDAENVANLVSQHQPRAVINCAAWTAVDAGETAARRAARHLIMRICRLSSVGDAGPVRSRIFLDTILTLTTARQPRRESQPT